MAQSQRLGLAHGDDLHVVRHGVVDRRAQIMLALAGQLMFQLVVVVEVVLDRLFATAGDQNDFAKTGGDRLFNHMLDHRLVDHRQHLFGDRLAGRKHAGAEAGDGNDYLAEHLFWSSHCS